jgi:hypothetical protein
MATKDEDKKADAKQADAKKDTTPAAPVSAIDAQERSKDEADNATGPGEGDHGDLIMSDESDIAVPDTD